MKKALTLLIALVATWLVFPVLAYAQVPNWQWAKSLGGSRGDFSKSITIDKDGNIILAGYSETATPGSGPKILSKFDAGGNKLWSKMIGGGADLTPRSVATDAEGNIAVCGVFKSPTITFGLNTFTNAGVWDMFLVKLSPDGDVLWAQTAGGNSHDDGFSVAFDIAGNVIMSGYYKSPSVTFGTTVFVNGGTNTTDLFLVKYDAGGEFLWAKRAGSSFYEYIRDITTDNLGNIIVTGDFSSSSISLGGITLSNTSDLSDAFLAKFDSNGNILWANKLDGVNFDRSSEIDIDAVGNIYVAGQSYSSTLKFGTISISNAGANDLFLAKYNSDGLVQWAKSVGGIKNENALGVSTDFSGNVFLCGVFESPTISFGANVLTNNGGDDLFLTRLDANGNVLWAKSAGSALGDSAADVVTDISGDVYLVGEFLGPSIQFDTTTLMRAGSADIFLAKIGGVSSDTSGTGKVERARIYPNPSTGHFFIQVEQIGQPTTLEVYDMLGRLRFSQHGTWSIDLTDFEAGVYMVVLKAGQSPLWTEKIIIRY